MSFLESIKSVYRNYAKFNGRALRSEYWWYALFSAIVSIVIGIFEGAFTGGAAAGGMSAAYNAGPIGMIWSLLNIIPGLAVGARRLHDTDRSGWWLLIGLIPIIGWIALIVFLAQRGTSGSNRFGDPA